MEYYAINTDPHLQHFGVKGMKWGVRRYQNEDGSYTDAGKKKYYNSDGSLTKAGMKQQFKEANRINNEFGNVYRTAKYNKKTGDYEIDPKKWEVAAKRAMSLAERNNDYELTDDMRHVVSCACLGGMYYEKAVQGYGITAKKGTQAYEYGRKKTRNAILALAAVETGVLAGVTGGILYADYKGR